MIQLAWRNIWRNAKRSMVTIILCTVCGAFLIFFESFNQGSHIKMIQDATEIYSGYIHVQLKGYQNQPDYDHFITHKQSLLHTLGSLPHIKAFSPRLEVPVLFSSHALSYGGILVGITPSSEMTVSRIKKACKIGRFLTDSDTNGVYLGVDLAEKLKVGLGDSMVFISSAMDRSMAADTLHIVGLFETHLFDSDAQLAFINHSFMDDVFLSHDMASYIVVNPHYLESVPFLQSTIQQAINRDDYDVLSWRELMQGFVQFVETDEAMGRLSVLIVILVVFFVIMIFQFMSIYYRQKEIGMMRAMGTPTWLIVSVLGMESFLMTSISLLCGGIFGSCLSLYFEKYPITFDFSEDVFEMYQQFGMVDLTMPALFSYDAIIFGLSIVLVINLLAIIYPIWKVLQGCPREALQG